MPTNFGPRSPKVDEEHRDADGTLFDDFVASVESSQLHLVDAHVHCLFLKILE